jgi:hypothetical protein
MSSVQKERLTVCSTLVIAGSNSFNIKIPRLCPRSLFMCLIRLSKYKKFISLGSMNRLLFTVGTSQCLLCGTN